MLILSDIMPNKKTLERELNSQRITEKDALNLGKTLATIHQKLSTINVRLRGNNEEKFYNQLLYYKLGIHNHNVLNETIDHLHIGPKQLILGDLSPKNIGFTQKRTYTICDLENFHNGNTISDIGLLGCSLILHTISNFSLASKLFSAFLRGYKSKIYIDENDIILKRIVLGIALYRLANPIIPYNLPITDSEKILRVQIIRKILNRRAISWDLIVAILTKGTNEN